MEKTNEIKALNVFQKKNLDWSQAYVLLTQGHQVRRSSWKPGALSVSIKDSKKSNGFFTIKTSWGESNWQPYHKDFGCNDWCVVEVIKSDKKDALSCGQTSSRFQALLDAAVEDDIDDFMYDSNDFH